MASNIPSGNVIKIGIPDSIDIPRLIYAAPYFNEVPLAELIEPSVIEAVNNVLPSLVPPYVDQAAQDAVNQRAVLLVGSTMSGPLFLSPLMPTQPSQAATMAYVDSMIATAGIPEVPPVPSGQVWARETGQWVPITPQTGVFLPLSGGSMTGNINMNGNTINNLAAVPALPNGAAPAQWVLNQIAAVSLFQGQWDLDTNVPDLTQLQYRVNGYTWIAITSSVSGVVIGPAVPGLQGKTVFNGDTVIYSTVDGAFFSIHAGGMSVPEANSLFVQLVGSQMSGPLLLNANASQPMQAVTLQQLEAFVPPGSVGEAPNDGQLYGRNGLTHAWSPVLPLAGGIMTGPITLSANAGQPLQPVPLQQMTSAISAATAGYLPLAGNAAMSGLFTLSGNATAQLNPVPLQQVNSMLAAYMPLSGGTFTGPVTLPNGSTISGYLPLTGGTLTGALTSTAGGIASIGSVQTAGAFQMVSTVPSGTVLAQWAATATNCQLNGAGGQTIPLCTINAASTDVTGAFQVAGSASVGGSISVASGSGTVWAGLLALAGSSPTAALAQVGAGGTPTAAVVNINAPPGQTIANIGLTATSVNCSGNLQAAGNVLASGALQAGTNVTTTSGNLVSNVGGIVFAWISPNGNAFGVRTGALDVYLNGQGQGSAVLSGSDENLKENFAAVTVDPLSLLNQIPLQQYDWKPQETGQPPHNNCGFTAQAAAALIPEASPPVPTGFPAIVDPLVMIGYLIGAVQRLVAMVQQLQTAVGALQQNANQAVTAWEAV